MEKKEIKTINIKFQKKHIIFGIVTFLVFFMSILYSPEKHGFEEYQQFRCTDGSIELATPNNSIYCGIDILNEGYYLENGVWSK